MAVAFLWFEPALLILLQVPNSTYHGTFEYFRVILIGIPFMMAYNLEAGLLQSIGNSKTPLFFLLFSSILNVFLDILFLKPMAMGIQGAAISTVLSQGISAFSGWFTFGEIILFCTLPEKNFMFLRDLSGICMQQDLVWRL